MLTFLTNILKKYYFLGASCASVKNEIHFQFFIEARVLKILGLFKKRREAKNYEFDIRKYKRAQPKTIEQLFFAAANTYVE